MRSRKNNLINDFIDEQAKLFLFYEKNWGSWTSASNSNKPEFTSASAANIYKGLRDQILETSEEPEKEYKEISEWEVAKTRSELLPSFLHLDT